MTTSPEEISAIRDEMISGIDLPEGFEPRMGVNLPLGGLSLQMAVYSTSDVPDQGGTVLMLMHSTLPISDEDLRRQMDQQAGNQELTIESRETRAVEVDGETINFEFSKGKMKKDGSEMRQVSGLIPGRKGSVLLLMFVPEENWDEEQVLEILKSIRK
jgi:hypothetical protein